MHRSRPLLALAGLGLSLSLAVAGPASAAAPPTGGHGHGHPGHGAASASRIDSTDLAPLTTVGGVAVGASGFGSAVAVRPGSDRVVYGLTDRGPNVDGPGGTKVLPTPDFTPSIGEFSLGGGRAHLLRTIPLLARDGSPLNGRVSTVAGTGETLTDLNGAVLDPSPNGIDSEGLAAAKDGTFWVSDEYGPFMAQFDRRGRMIQRLSPQEGTLPRELAERDPNKGMEGLTITPDGRTLVGIMQAALDAPDNTTVKSKKISAVRIVTIDLRTRAAHEYVYVLHSSGGASTVVSEISAIDDHTFLVDERDSETEPGANKKLYGIDLRGATDVGPCSSVPGAVYDGEHGGLLAGGRTIERLAGTGNTEATTAALTTAGVQPVSSRLFLDLGGYLTAVDPSGGYFGHDKIEGVAVLDGGRRLVISNDSDFGIDATTGDAAPFGLHAKTLPGGSTDSGEYLTVDVGAVPAAFRG